MTKKALQSPFSMIPSLPVAFRIWAVFAWKGFNKNTQNLKDFNESDPPPVFSRHRRNCLLLLILPDCNCTIPDYEGGATSLAAFHNEWWAQSTFDGANFAVLR